MKRYEKLLKKAAEHDMKVYDALIKDGSFETLKNSIGELQRAYANSCLEFRKERMKKTFFIGTTAGSLVLLFKERFSKRKLNKEESTNED